MQRIPPGCGELHGMKPWGILHIAMEATWTWPSFFEMNDDLHMEHGDFPVRYVQLRV
jgi:hypothetical protein